ncbi:kinase-like domain-containing protein [Syncephalis plumigaleata]|nr:kinase-like domain-containing protein [Syncephalis plumigaleata]
MTSRQLRPTALLASRSFSSTVTTTTTTSSTSTSSSLASSSSSSGANNDVVVATVATKRTSILSLSNAKSVFARKTPMGMVTTRSDGRDDVQTAKTSRRSWPAWLPSWLNGKRPVNTVAVKPSITTSYINNNNNAAAASTTCVADAITTTTPTSTPNGMGVANQALHAGYPGLTMFSTDAYNVVSNAAVNTPSIPVVSTIYSSLGSPVSSGKASPIVLVASSNPNYPPTTKYTMDLTILRGQVHMLVNSLLPDWHDVHDPDALEITRLSGALTNRVYEVRFRDPNDTKHTSRRVLLRVYGSGELDWLRKLSAEGLGPRLLAVFGNGRLEEYFRSVTLTHDDLRDPTTCQKIAQMLDTDKSPMDMLQQLDQEIVHYEMSAIRANSPVVLGHNDVTTIRNILRLRDKPDTLVLIDFEYAGYNPRDTILPIISANGWRTIMERDTFLRAYLTEALDHTPTDGEVNELWKEVEQFIPCSHLVWALWGLLQADRDDIDFDYLAYGAQRFVCHGSMHNNLVFGNC